MADPGHDTSFDEAADSALGRMAGLAASIVDAPIASIALHADGGLWCTSTDDLDDARKLHRTSLCAHMSEAGRPLVVADASIDERFRADPAVASSPQIRFYAGIPLTTTDGRHLGSLNIADVRPRTALDTADMQKLQDLAALIVDRIRCSQERKRALRLPPVSPAVLAAMSHDIRTPMNGVLGMAEVLLTADDLSDRNRRRIDIIKRSGEQLLSMLDGIIELSRIESEETTPQTARFDLVEIVQDVLAQVGLPASGQEIRFDPPGDRLQVAGDAARLKRLLLRFLESATGFASERDIKMDVGVRSTGEGRVRARFEIGNANIDGDELGRIFTAVEQGDLRELDGFGEACLGPVICRKLAAEMGGVLGVERPAGSSPVLWLECDLDASATSAAATVGTPKEAPVDAAADRTKVIRDVLIAEDNPDMALLIEDLLDEAGYQVTVAHDGASVLKVMAEKHVDLVLMDGRMPDMSGFETTRLIRQLPDGRADVPIIALTAEALAGDRERYLAAGMDDYVAKPVDYEALVSAIERCSSLRR